MESNNLEHYILLSDSILNNPVLNPTEKMLFAYIVSLSTKDGFCFASNKHLAKILHVVPHTISKKISKLKKLGIVEVKIIRDVKGMVMERRIYPKGVCPEKDIGYVPNGTKCMSQNVQYINKKINKKGNIYPLKSNFNEIRFDPAELESLYEN